MTHLNEFQDYYYDLVLKKSLDISIKSVDCYIELSNKGQEMSILTTICQGRAELKENVLRKQQYFREQNFLIDTRNKQVVIARKFDFTRMSPDTFALKMAQFHSDVLKCRSEMGSLEEGVLIPR
ncbi:MAG: hypothetical protein S4CHLAM6_11130 [Chlamydiae bacterium]|nr:hypothetical protein [Chlamydiota bacterium]